MLDSGPMKVSGHMPTIAEKVTVKSGKRIWGIICAQCSDYKQEYTRCEYIKNFPEELVEEV